MSAHDGRTYSEPVSGATAGQALSFTWDYRQPAPMDEIAAAVRELSGGTVRMSMPETGGDEYALVISHTGPQPALWECEFCPAKFAYLPHAEAHVLTEHPDAGPHAADGKTAGQQACETFWAAVRRLNGGEDAGDWPGNAWEWAADTGARPAWDETAAAVETRQLRLAREGRDSLKRRVLALAAEYGDACGNDKIDGYAPGSLYTALRAEVLNAAGGRLRKLLEDE